MGYLPDEFVICHVLLKSLLVSADSKLEKRFYTAYGCTSSLAGSHDKSKEIDQETYSGKWLASVPCLQKYGTVLFGVRENLKSLRRLFGYKR